MLVAPPTVKGEGSTTQVDPYLVDTPVRGVSLSGPPPRTSENDIVKVVLIDSDHTTTKWGITWMDSPFIEDIGANAIGKCLLKKCNVKF